MGKNVRISKSLKSIHSNSHPIEPVLVWSVLWSLDTLEQDDQSAGLDSSSPCSLPGKIAPSYQNVQQ
jgi:hypothetical protein